VVLGRNSDKYFKKSVMQQSETESDGEFMEPEVESEKNKIKVFDRFTIILQIFAKRAKTKISKL
jgi:hypothetical protein